jgi:hypothetical protein
MNLKEIIKGVGSGRCNARGNQNPGRLWSRPGLIKVFYLTLMVTVEVKAGL